MSNLPRSESLIVAFHREWNVRVKETLVAFANTAGGDLYLGVDADGSIVGLKNPAGAEAALAAVVRDDISPSLIGCLAIQSLTMSGKTILRVHVDAGPLKPYCLDPKTASGIFLREGSINRAASLADITRLVRAGNPLSYEDRPAFDQNTTFAYCETFCHDRHVAFDPQNPAFGFWNASLQVYTNLAAICSDQSAVRCVMTSFSDDNRSAILGREDVTGSIFEIFDRATVFLTRRNQAGNGACFIEPVVIASALTTLLAHHDYGLSPAFLISVTPSAVTLFATGSLLEGLSVRAVAELMSIECRNPKLAHFFQALHLDIGFDLIRCHYRTTPLESLLQLDSTAFTIRLPRRPALSTDVGTHGARVLELLSQRAPVTRQEIQTHLAVSQTTAVNVIKALLEKGLLEKTAEGRSTKYRIKGLG